MKGKGWHFESNPHSMAARGISLGRGKKKAAPKPIYKQVPESIEGTHFKINDKITVVARYEKTRNGFRHIADLYVNGIFKESSKVTYQNRTWESYDFETVLKKVIGEAGVLSEEEKKVGLDFAKDYENVNRRNVEKEFGQIATIAKLGEVFGQTPKEKNDWKARMLKAGLGNQGLEMPEDWETLDEDTKKKRLDAVIKMMGEKKERI
jgi:hypothetical protein